MKNTLLLLAYSTLLLGAGVLVGVEPSGADFTDTSETTAVATASPDWVAPSVTLAGPGASVKDTITLTAQAADSGTGVQDVVIQHLANGSETWTTICTDTTAPYTCAWNTRSVTDGSYALRARATDKAGYATTSEIVTTVVANAPLVVLGDPGDVLRGTVPLTTTVHSGGSLPYTVRVEYVASGGSNWRTACTASTAPFTCSWNTAATGSSAVANGPYDLRAVATTGTNTYTSAVLSDILVDNAAPSVTMTDPGSPLSGTRTFAASAADVDSGVAQIVLQYAVTGSSTWQNLCTLTDTPYSCSVPTRTIPDGLYSFRAVATDVAGNAATSAAVTNRRIDNTVSSVSVTDPGPFLSGTVVVTADASSTAGVTSVRIQRAPSGTGTWTDLCTDTVAPYACSWDTTTVADGLHDLRAVLVDGRGTTVTSATVSARRVDNSPLRAVDVQATNGGAAVGKLDAGDTLTLTYSGQVALGTVTGGWDGSALAVTLRARDGGLLGLGSRDDTLDLNRSGATVNLGSVNLKGDFVRNGRTATLNATMAAATVVTNGVPQTVITVRIGSVATVGGALRTNTVSGAMVWTPSAVVTDLAGKPSAAAPATESGSADRDF